MHTSLSFPILALAGALLLSSCSSSSKNNPVAPKPSPSDSIHASYGAGEFGYTMLGETFDRTLPKYIYYCYADFLPNPGSTDPSTSMLLSIEFFVKLDSTAVLPENVVLLVIPVPRSPQLGSYPIGPLGDRTKAGAGLMRGGAGSDAMAGGSIVITEFDTVNNGVSGTFSLTFPSTGGSGGTVTITGGHFSKVPIYRGSFGQGVVTANIDGVPFSTAGGGRHFSYATIRGDQPGMFIDATESDGNGNTTECQFRVPTIGTGSYSFTSSGSNLSAEYLHSGTADQLMNTDNGAVGHLTITSFDTVKRRLSGTFDLRGTDTTTGDSIRVSNGVLKDVLWFRL